MKRSYLPDAPPNPYPSVKPFIRSSPFLHTIHCVHGFDLVPEPLGTPLLYYIDDVERLGTATGRVRSLLYEDQEVIDVSALITSWEVGGGEAGETDSDQHQTRFLRHTVGGTNYAPYVTRLSTPTWYT
jgi:hypothetical protein